MTRSRLRRLADEGVGPFPLAALPDLVSDLRALAEHDGNRVLEVIAATLEAVDAASAKCNEERGQGLPREITEPINSVLSAELPALLADDTDATELYRRALAFKESIDQVLIDNASWVERYRDEQKGTGWRERTPPEYPPDDDPRWIG